MPQPANARRAIGDTAFNDIRRVRAFTPSLIAERLAERRRRPFITEDGRLFIIAAGHPARGVLGVRGNPMAMSNRYDLLDRLATALALPGVDGVLGTPDIIEDLALLGLLDDKIAVGSMNRGGIRSSEFELDDRATSCDIPGIVSAKLDAAKTLVRIDLSDSRSVDTIEATARSVTAASEARIPIIVEPFMCRRTHGHLANDLSPDAVVTSLAIASGLGASSAYTWLKIPLVAEMERVMESTTLPTLLLGGDPPEPERSFDDWSRALALPGVRGLVVGRSLLFPPGDDVAAAVRDAAAIVHPAAQGEKTR